MTILINDQEIEFTLEGGEKASEIYDSLKNFLRESGYLVYSFVLDGIPTDPEEMDIWGDKKKTEINRIEVTALTDTEYRLTGLLTIAEYINFLAKSVSDGDFSFLNGFDEDYPSILKNINLFLPGELGMLVGEQLEKTIKKSGLLIKNFDGAFRNEFLKEIGGIAELIDMTAREIEDPKRELEASFKALQIIKPRLSDVSLLLQTGKDRGAMEIIINLTEILNKIFRLLNIFNTDNINTEKLNSVLGELADAFSSGDSVLIGDLLEYEISPLLGDLEEVVEEIRKTEE